MDVTSLFDCLPADVRYARRELPAERNALGPWTEAVNLLREQGRIGDAVYAMKGYCECGKCAALAIPSDREIDELLALNAPVLALTDEGDARGDFQFPPQSPAFGKDLSGDVVIGLRLLVRIRILRVQRFLSQGNLEKAAAEAIAIHRMGELICHGEGLLWQWMVGQAILKIGLSEIKDVASSDWDSSDAKRLLHAEIESAISRDDGRAATLRVEACSYALPMIAWLPQQGSVEELVDSLLRYFYAHEPIANRAEYISGDDSQRIPDAVVASRLAERRRQILTLLENHSAPFDARATARRVGELTDAAIRGFSLNDTAPSRFRQAWTWSRERLGLTGGEGIDFAWPSSLRPDVAVDFLGRDQRAVAERASLSTTMTGRDIAKLAPVGERRLRSCKSRLQRIDNPVGEIVAELLTAHSGFNLADQYREQLAALRSMWERRAAS